MKKKDWSKFNIYLVLFTAIVFTAVNLAMIFDIRPAVTLYIPQLEGKEITLLGFINGMMYIMFSILLMQEKK